VEKSAYTYPRYGDLVQQALAEDIGSGDVTTLAIVGKDKSAKARIVAKAELVLAGVEVAEAVFRKLDKNVSWRAEYPDGSRLAPGDVIAEVAGNARAILTAERTALNFLQHLSGIASLTAKYVALLESYNTKLKDTRKTNPGLRALEKYAVKCGGGENHRFGLFDAILIKDNHIAFAGGIAQAIKLTRQNSPTGLAIEIEAQSLTQVEQALSGGAEIIMLDNMDIDTLAQAVKLIAGRAKTEVSGGLSGEHIIEIAKLGVDYISMGKLTNSAPAVDIHMRFI
jgi:nicotinate-nucleotide pyrophosphorylase (carboxylating)